MERYARVRFSESKFVHDARYIHKYYLPQELRTKIFPVDIDGISSCFSGDNEYLVREELIPDKVPDCIIQYKDIGLEKRIDGETVRRVMFAMAAYYADVSGELTTRENQASMNLNDWFIEWEKALLARCIQLSSEMEQKVRSGDSWLTDYEIDVEVAFSVRDDDPYHMDNMPDNASDDDIDRDTSLLCTMKDLKIISCSKAGNNDYYGIGDDQDHNECRGYRDEGIFNVRHCITFHELFSHMQIPIKHAARIGYVASDIIVRHQNGVDIDLKRDNAIAVRDEPRIREYIGLCDEETQKPANF